MLGLMENKLWLQEELSAFPPGAVVYNKQQRVAVLRFCSRGQARSKADGCRTDGAKHVLEGSTGRPAEDVLALAQYEALSKRRAWWGWSNAGWPFRSRGHGSILTSRRPWCREGCDVNIPRCFEDSVAEFYVSHQTVPACRNSLMAPVQSAASRDAGCGPTRVPFRPPIRRLPVQWNAEGA
jgi:hypothetical protein